MNETILDTAQLALKVTSAAKAIDVSTITIRRMIKKGEITPVRKLRHLLIPVEQLKAWLQK